MKNAIEILNKLHFHNKSIVGLDIECVSGTEPYNNWPLSDKNFVDTNLPTHKMCAGKFARWITIANPFGFVTVIDCSKISQEVLKLLEEFLMNHDTIVVMFGASEDLWSLHLTFGKILSGTGLKPPFPKHIRKNSMFSKMRVFDLKNLLDFVCDSRTGPYNQNHWKKLGIFPGGRGLWDLGTAILGLDLSKYDLSIKPFQWARYWNIENISDAQKLYMTLDPLVTVHNFMALFHFNLFPDAESEIPKVSSDFLDVENFQNAVKNFSNDSDCEIFSFIDNEKIILAKFIENASAKFSSIKPKDVFCDKNNYEKIQEKFGIFPKLESKKKSNGGDKISDSSYVNINFISKNSEKRVFFDIKQLGHFDFENFGSKNSDNGALRLSDELPGDNVATHTVLNEILQLQNPSSFTSELCSLNLDFGEFSLESKEQISVDSSVSYVSDSETVSSGNAVSLANAFSSSIDIVKLIEERSYFKALADIGEPRRVQLENENAQLKADLTSKDATIAQLRFQLSGRTAPRPSLPAPADKRFSVDRPRSTVARRHDIVSPRNQSASPIVGFREIDFLNQQLYAQDGFENDKYPVGCLNPRYIRCRDAFNKILRKFPDRGNDKVQKLCDVWREMAAECFKLWVGSFGEEEAVDSLKYLLQFLILQNHRVTEFTQTRLEHAMTLARHAAEGIVRAVKKNLDVRKSRVHMERYEDVKRKRVSSIEIRKSSFNRDRKRSRSPARSRPTGSSKSSSTSHGHVQPIVSESPAVTENQDDQFKDEKPLTPGHNMKELFL